MSIDDKIDISDKIPIIRDFAEIYTTIDQAAKQMGIDPGIYKLRYDEEVLEYIKRTANNQKEIDLMIDLYARYKYEWKRRQEKETHEIY
jgi:hypothetical protein